IWLKDDKIKKKARGSKREFRRPYGSEIKREGTLVENVVRDRNPVGMEDGTEQLWEAARDTRFGLPEQSQ
ncbi:hypothetical protein L9F63_017848, partial [Diploptera punctata]